MDKLVQHVLMDFICHQMVVLLVVLLTVLLVMLIMYVKHVSKDSIWEDLIKTLDVLLVNLE
jgi:heme/copper-type cytochrome/quinol oxidase subunit 2